MADLLGHLLDDALVTAIGLQGGDGAFNLTLI
jgi:hypothetical protein